MISINLGMGSPYLQMENVPMVYLDEISFFDQVTTYI